MTTNPFADPLRFERRVPECAIVIFGASGDLTKRKLMPALYRLDFDRRLPANFAIIGNSRTPMSDDAFREKMREGVEQFLEDSPFDESLWNSFARNIYYLAGDSTDSNFLASLKSKLDELNLPRVLYYLSTQPSLYGPIVDHLGLSKLNQPKPGGWTRIVIEKPFGHDLASAVTLNERIHAVFPEPSVYRIDHYLGKETVQNILALRFGNGIFEPLWNRRFIDHIQITAAESIGVEGRGAYYQEAGALRDMIQNHLLQVMATVAMEPPAVYEPDAVRDERSKLLRSIRILRPEEVDENAVAGQYRGFREEPGVKPDAQTDTFAAATFHIENWRWAGVPFYIRSGKKLAKRTTDIVIQFSTAPYALFTSDDAGPPTRPNLLILRIQPEEGVSLQFASKNPGSGMRLRPVSMDFNYGSSFGQRSPTAYETLLMDAMIGDATLYTRQDMVEASWRAVEPILENWESREFDFPDYEPGTWGPAASDAMLARQGHRWRNA